MVLGHWPRMSGRDVGSQEHEPAAGVVTWQLNTGLFVDTDENGDEIAFTRDYGPVTSDWKIAGIGDVNGDGNSDIFWRHDFWPAGELGDR